MNTHIEEMCTAVAIIFCLLFFFLNKEIMVKFFLLFFINFSHLLSSTILDVDAVTVNIH